LQRIEDEVSIGIYGNMTTMRKNKLNLLQFKLENVLIKTNKETFIRELLVRLEIELYNKKQLESFLIKKI
jgi:hypothetical protein